MAADGVRDVHVAALHKAKEAATALTEELRKISAAAVSTNVHHIDDEVALAYRKVLIFQETLNDASVEIYRNAWKVS